MPRFPRRYHIQQFKNFHCCLDCLIRMSKVAGRKTNRAHLTRHTFFARDYPLPARLVEFKFTLVVAIII